jgi:hypothetical protein
MMGLARFRRCQQRDDSARIDPNIAAAEAVGADNASADDPGPKHGREPALSRPQRN